ncbi:MAG: MFS transporter [Pseudomonadota bacterium]
MAETQATNDAPVDRKRKVPLRTKLLFASGGMQEATIGAAGIVTVLFYNQVLGVSPALAGTAFLIASIVDAVSDPLIGALSDRARSRWGRRHPFMFASALPIGIAFYLLYQPMEGLSEMGYFIWLTTFLVLLRLAQTFYLIPHDALGAELTDDYEERSSIFGYNAVAHMLLALLAAGVLYALIFPSTPHYDNGFLDEGRYIILAAVGSVTIVLSVLVCAFGTLDQLPYMHDVDISKKFNVRNYMGQLLELLKNRSYLSACLSLLTMYAGLGILGVVATYAYTYVYELSTEQQFWAGVAKMPGVLIAIPLLALLSKFMEKKAILIMSTLITCVMISLPHNLRMLDLFPANDSPIILFALFVPLLLGYLIFPVSAIIIDSQLVDVADEHELKTRERSEGVIFSVRSFGIKATSGVGGFLAGFGLEFIGFPENAVVGNLALETQTGLLFLNGPLYLIIYLLAAAFMTLYAIDKKKHAAILAELESRRAESEVNTAN